MTSPLELDQNSPFPCEYWGTLTAPAINPEPGTGDRQKSTPYQYEDIAIAQAVQLINARVTPLSSERIPVLESVGRRLARPVVSRRPVPSFRRAAMDGYAVRGCDINRSSTDDVGFEVVGESLPGRPFANPIGPHQCVRIGTGAPLPLNADTVVRWENVRLEHNRIELLTPVKQGKDVAEIGEDIRADQQLIGPPRTLRPQDVATCCSTGIECVDVFRIPRVAILSTGDELLPVGAEPGYGQIIDTNSVLLKSCVERDAGRVINWSEHKNAIFPDRLETIRSAIQASARTSELILISGGTSHGPADYVVRVIAELGDLVFRGIRMKPGAPTAFGSVSGVPVVLLPGNPVACLLAYDMIARAIIRKLGSQTLDWPYTIRRMRLAEALKSATGRLDFIRVQQVNETHVSPLRVSGASILSSTVTADGFLIIPEERESLSVDEEVEVHLFEQVR